MPLWRKTDSASDSAKPKWLSDDEKSRTFATEQGWIYEQKGGTKEILVAIRGLDVKLGAPTVDNVSVSATSVTDGDILSLFVKYNEPVVVTGGPTVTGTDGTNPVVFTYNGVDSTPENGLMMFLTDTTGLGAVTISLAADTSIALAGGTITDGNDGTTAAELELGNDLIEVVVEV